MAEVQHGRDRDPGPRLSSEPTTTSTSVSGPPRRVGEGDDASQAPHREIPFTLSLRARMARTVASGKTRSCPSVGSFQHLQLFGTSHRQAHGELGRAHPVVGPSTPSDRLREQRRLANFRASPCALPSLPAVVIGPFRRKWSGHLQPLGVISMRLAFLRRPTGPTHKTGRLTSDKPISYAAVWRPHFIRQNLDPITPSPLHLFRPAMPS